MQTRKSKEQRRRQIVRMTATALGLYMRARLSGLSGDNELKRHKALGELAKRELGTNKFHN